MRVLITGASGTIGSALANELIVGGHTVLGLSRNPAQAARKLPAVDWHAWQPPQPPPERALAGCDAVVNLIGERIDQRLTRAAKERIRRSRVDATRALVDAIAALPENDRPRVLISQSAVGYYGDRGDEEVDEESPPGRDFLAQVCVDWEAAARQASAHGLRVAVLRTGLVLSKDSGLLARLAPIFKLGLGGKIASGRQWMPWIHLADELGLLRWLVEGTGEGTFNATAPNPVRNAEFSRTLGRVVRRPALLPVPRFALDLAFGRELAAALVSSQQALPKRALEGGYRFRFERLDAALSDLLR